MNIQEIILFIFLIIIVQILTEIIPFFISSQTTVVKVFILANLSKRERDIVSADEENKLDDDDDLN